MLVGEDVVILKVGYRDDLAGGRGEAILYDFYDCLYTVALERSHGGHRVQVPPEVIKKAAPR